MRWQRKVTKQVPGGVVQATCTFFPSAASDPDRLDRAGVGRDLWGSQGLPSLWVDTPNCPFGLADSTPDRSLFFFFGAGMRVCVLYGMYLCMHVCTRFSCAQEDSTYIIHVYAHIGCHRLCKIRRRDGSNKRQHGKPSPIHICSVIAGKLVVRQRRTCTILSEIT